MSETLNKVDGLIKVAFNGIAIPQHVVEAAPRITQYIDQNGPKSEAIGLHLSMFLKHMESEVRSGHWPEVISSGVYISKNVNSEDEFNEIVTILENEELPVERRALTAVIGRLIFQNIIAASYLQ